ncbi:MAG: ABC transporter ATP-binding protein [Deltaproteobacteria bacterium]|nr:ABC transporter ATP-binding protein [Deltaproteobacteria bacterium]
MTRKLAVVADRSPAIKKCVLEVRNLRKVFRTEGSYLNVIDRLSFDAHRGELLCIFGRSGCGKSTLLKILSGFIAPSSGQVRLNGRPILGPGPDRCVVFQEDALFPWLTVAENIAFGLRGKKWNKGRIREDVERFLSLVGLSEFRNYLPREISGGMKQRVALARVLILQPEVLLMDEPFAALDAQTREEMQTLLLSLMDRLSHTILFVTHDVNEAVTLADRVLILDKDPGRVRDDIRIDLPRPRTRNGEPFLLLCNRLLESLRG